MSISLSRLFFFYGYRAHRHLHSFPTRRSSDLKPVQGFTGDQQFFLSFAQSWRQKLREPAMRQRVVVDGQDRKSTRLNSSHRTSSYAVFCLKKKTSQFIPTPRTRTTRPLTFKYH